MTTEEFDNTKFLVFDKIEYKGEVKRIMSVDFEERLIGFNVENDSVLSWARHENIKLL